MCNQEKLIALYCSVDDFWKAFKLEWEKHLLGNGKSNRGPEPKLTIPEMMTIIILFHQSQYRWLICWVPGGSPGKELWSASHF